MALLESSDLIVDRRAKVEYSVKAHPTEPGVALVTVKRGDESYTYEVATEPIEL